MPAAPSQPVPWLSSLTESMRTEKWSDFFLTIFGTWMAVWLSAALHNQYLIRIAPEHFTVYHDRLPYFTNHTALGVAWAFLASCSPGLLLGMCLYVAGRLFLRPKLRPRSVILSVFWVWLAVEICSLLAGLIVWRTGQGLYPDWIYPDKWLPLLVTQTIQITAYLSGAFFSVLLIALTWRRRKQLSLPLS